MPQKYQSCGTFLKVSAVMGIILVVLAASGCGGPKIVTQAVSTASGPSAATAADTAKPDRPLLNNSTIEGDLAENGFLDSADGILRVAGRSQLRLSLKTLNNPPAAPQNWEFTSPVFEITAQDRQNRAVRQLSNALDLRFKVDLSKPSTVLVYGDSAWEVVPSEVTGEGLLTASINHLTPYTTGAPAISRSVTPTPARSLTATRPSASYTTGTVSAADAQNALARAAKSLKKKEVRITSAAGYTGSLYIALPPTLQESLGNALDSSGAAYYGLYNALNEAITAEAAGGQAAGSFTILVEPRTAWPVSAAEAHDLLTALFPGADVPLTQAADSATAYIFYGVVQNTACSLGCISYNGLILCYAVSGTGTYQSLVTRN